MGRGGYDDGERWLSIRRPVDASGTPYRPRHLRNPRDLERRVRDKVNSLTVLVLVSKRLTTPVVRFIRARSVSEGTIYRDLARTEKESVDSRNSINGTFLQPSLHENYIRPYTGRILLSYCCYPSIFGASSCIFKRQQPRCYI